MTHDDVITRYQTLDHWLSVISFRAAESPVLLVGTHADSKKISSDTGIPEEKRS